MKFICQDRCDHIATVPTINLDEIHSLCTGLLRCFEVIRTCPNNHRDALIIGQIHNHYTRPLHVSKYIYIYTRREYHGQTTIILSMNQDLTASKMEKIL
jgi:hypothetical protein